MLEPLRGGAAPVSEKRAGEVRGHLGARRILPAAAHACAPASRRSTGRGHSRRRPAIAARSGNGSSPPSPRRRARRQSDRGPIARRSRPAANSLSQESSAPAIASRTGPGRSSYSAEVPPRSSRRSRRPPPGGRDRARLSPEAGGAVGRFPRGIDHGRRKRSAAAATVASCSSRLEPK